MSHQLINPGDTVTIMHRLTDATGTVLTTATVASVTVTIYDLDADAIISTTTPSVSSVIVSLTTDPAWTTDSIGFNYLFTAPGSSFATAGHTYTVTTSITPTAGTSSQVVDVIQTRLL